MLLLINGYLKIIKPKTRSTNVEHRSTFVYDEVIDTFRFLN